MEDSPNADAVNRYVEAWTIGEALQRLSSAHRQVLTECFYQGRSVAEAATRLSLPVGTVRSRTHYAVHHLRLVLQEMGVTA